MRLQIGPSIDNNRVRLDFRRSPDRPENTPSYQIESSKANEFVKIYNSQSKTLNKFTVGSATILSGMGLAYGIKKKSILASVLGVFIGLLAGLGIGAGIASRKNSNLMDKYDVKEISQV